ncbi:HTH-type transcriptional regulator EthR [Winogradskya consettensis]|uniref:HTH-type transcriptional regulator EthR n=1 Tax=Winogradskya consettensis TaxID=113560 RepID=A0A919SBF4_9ACTN|nr:TetR/AcrR family transcriptional regulator [Actinoplanes consettensis]GIM69525.1 HTH-type transcriptional regulator EthR [Actinoplanes consettensis]
MSDTSTGRRRGLRKGDAREADILRTFETLIAERTLASISIDELAHGAGLSRPTFYFYFKSKDAVLAALLHEIETQVSAAQADWYRGSGIGDTEASLRQNMGYIVDLWKARGPLLRLIHFATDVPAEVLEYRKRYQERLTRLNTERIERERAAGLAPAGPPSSAALATAMIQLRTVLLCDAFASQDDTAPVADPDQLIEDLVAAQLRLLYGQLPARLPA